MRVPPQRSSRSNTASTTPGKRVSSTSANASSNKKRKLATDAPPSSRTKKPDAKKKQLSSKQQVKKVSSPTAAAKLLKAVTSAKKTQLNKHKIVPLVGLKKIKIKEGRVTIKKILMTTGGAKAQKKQAKPVAKATVGAKKQLNVAGGKKMTGAAAAVESQPTSSTSEDQMAGSSCDSDKKSAKKVKGVKKPKGPSTSVAIPLTRTKKLQQRQKLKKITVQRVPVTRKIMITQKISSGGGKKKVATRRKQGNEDAKGGTAEENIPTLIVKGSRSPLRESEGVEAVHTGGHIISVVLQSSKATSTKKAKEDEGAIKKKNKGKPKMEDVAKGYEPTKDKSEMPKKEGKPSAKKQQKVKLPTAKSKAAKKSPVVKSLQVISKKLPLSSKASPKATAKKTQQPKKKLLSKKVSPKEEPSDDYESRNEDEQKSPASNDGDSSTSDEITLDVLLLRQQQMKQEVLSGAEQNPCSTDKPSLPLVKTEGSCSSRSVTAAASPLSINTSDDEDLKSIKNRIKVKLENDSESEERSSKKKTKSGQYGGVVIKKEVMTPEKDSDSKSSSGKQVARKALGVKKTPRTGMKRSRSDKSTGSGSDTEQRARRMKLFGFWSGPKRHRVASLNALAKVHCLYENEGRGAFLGICASGGNSLQRTPKPSAAAAARSQQSTNVQATTLASTRTLRSAPGMRGMGKHWDMHNASSTTSSSTSSDDTDDSNSDSPETPPTMPPSFKQKKQQQQKLSVKQKQVNKVVKRRRKRNELMMDLKDMVVRKRMASLNASAILAASYSFEKRPAKTKEETNEGESSSGNVQQGKKKKKKKKRLSKKVVEVEDDSSSVSSDLEVEECDLEGRGGGSGQSVIEVRGRGPNSNKKVAVIVNQDTDVTITGVYVNSTTRSTHHEGFCSIAGMQYRISSTSHTQTEATAVATETMLHTSTAAEHPPAEPPLAPPMKSYTPLGALSNMQPPGSGVVGGPPPPPPHHHHHPHPHAHPPHPHAPPPCTVPPPPQQPPPHRPGPVNPGGQPISPLGRRHGCSSAFSAPPPPPGGSYGPQPPHHHPPPQGQTDPAYIHGYYQPAGPLISTHHHHHSASSSSSITNSGGKVLPTLEASPTPTPPPSAASSGSVPPPPTSSASGVAPPQQIVSVTSSGGESSDNDVIITATSCSGGGEVAPPVPPAGYRYPQSYPPPPTPSTPQHLHHQAYSYNYPHTQYYPSPPASASIQYSAVATNPQHHAHYHNQDLCYSSTANYPPASYFHHKSYSTPPPASYHRRYIPPPHPAQYYSTSDLYSNPASNVSQPNSNQSQQSQQMVVTGSGTGSASSYQPPPAPPPPPLVGVSNNPPPPPPLVETYPPPVSIVDPYAGAPAYYGSYGAGPGATGCYTHSPPTRSLAFIDAAYQSCPCPMQSCPKNVHTGPLTGDGKGPSHIASKQQQQPPVQESGASFHQLPLPPVALALPLEPPGALGPPSPARGSAGMPPPPSPATASARNPSQCQEEAAFQQRSWDSSNAESLSTLDGKIFVKSKQEPSGQDYVGETHLFASLSVAQDLQLKGDTETTSEEAISRHGLLTISKVSNPDPACRAKSRKNSPPASNIVPLLMCKIQNSDGPMTKLEEMPILDSNIMNSSVKTEVRNMEKETLVEKKSAGVIQNGSKTVFRNGSSRKRKDVPGNEVAKMETEVSVPKRRKLSTSNVVTSKLSSFDPDSQKTNGTFDSEDQLSETQTKCKSAQKTQPLSSNSCSLHNAKQNVRKRKLDDGKDLAENKEPVPVPVKKKQIKVQTKIYPSRAKPVKNVASSESLKKIDEVLESVVRTNTETLFPVKKSDAPVIKKAPGNKMAERKKETKINGVLLHQKKPLLRHQSVKNHEESSGDSAKARASQTNVNHVRVEGKKAQHCKKSDVLLPLEESSISGKKSRVNHMLRSHGLRDSLSERSSSDDAESNIPGGKVGSCSSSALTNRRVSTGSRKEQIKKPLNTIMRNDQSTKKQLHIQGTQELASYARKPAPRKSLQSPKWSNGWKFEGEPFESKVFTAIDDMPVMRKCYPLMRHQEGDVICPRDCVLLKSGPRKTDLPFVAKVASLWENPDDGEMMVSLLWYYRPEHTDQGRREDDMEDEIFASKHKDINSVACIEDKCYVLTFNEYCRYRKGVRRLEDGIKEPGLVVPQHEDYPRENRQPPGYVAPELVFFCRRVYDFRQRRILKNPG